MAVSTYAKNVILDAIVRGVAPASSATYLSLHTADPGSTGASEVAGGSPAYARTAITWNPASGGSIDDATSSALNVPGSTTVTHFGLWDALSAGNFLMGGALPVPETFGAQGTYTPSNVALSI